MTLELIDLRPAAFDDLSWMPPFDEAVGYAHPDWWNPRLLGIDDPWYVQVLEAGAEVARIEHYVNVPTIGPERLEIAFIEVATAECGRGIGTQAVRALEQRHHDRRLLAYSEEADGFWSELGWEPFHYPDDDWRTLFIQPAGGYQNPR